MSNNDSLDEIREQKIEELRQQEGQSPAESSAPSEPISIGSSEELSEAIETYDVVLADFYADWCGPCQMIAPTVAEIAAETDAAVAKIDVDTNQQLAASYQVQGVPTLVLFAGGESVEKIVGVQGKDSLVSLVQQHL